MACAFCFCLDLFGYLEISQTSRLCRVSLPCLPKLKLRGQERAHTGAPRPLPRGRQARLEPMSENWGAKPTSLISVL